MTAWAALILSLLNLAVWGLVGYAARKLYRQAQPYLGMLGLGGSIEMSAVPPAGTAAAGQGPAAAAPDDRCIYVAPSGARCLLAKGHGWSDDPHSHQFDRDPLL